MNAPGSSTTPQNWLDANQRRLTAEIARVRRRLERQATGGDAGPQEEVSSTDSLLDRLCDDFQLSPFERDVLLLCVGAELDGNFAAACAAASGDARRTQPTFGLALAALDRPHWSAVTPAGPLRRWRLVELGPGETLTSSPLRVDERTLHFLTGVQYLDERLESLIDVIPPPVALPASYREHGERIAKLAAQPADERPIVLLEGNARGGKRALAAAVCEAIGLRLHELEAADIPTGAVERELFVRLWERESVFLRSALFITAEDPVTRGAAQALAERLQGLLFVAGPALCLETARPVVRLEIDRPAEDEQRALWAHALGPCAEQLNGELDALVAQFPLDVAAIERTGRTVRDSETNSVVAALWDACRSQARRSLDGLAQRIEAAARWDDLVLPDEPLQALRAVAAQVRQRTKVHGAWGFAGRGQRGLGISALFAGPSGTGKTMAAEVLANELRLDLFRIDLSQVVSKYIGETEKNLSAVFAAAENAGAILLFDEADALFGKRSEVKDSHDRYANIEVSYLLQRMEAYRGLAILTTNLRGALDPAFLRRIRFVVTFPFPDADQRARIWQRVFPAETPTAGLDFSKLARLSVSGGNIRNIALGAAFLAADAGEAVGMRHLFHSARGECLKIDKPLTAGEIGGWV